MACFAAAVLLICLLGIVNLSGAKDACDLYATVGQSVTVPFVYVAKANTDTMRWTHNSTIVFYGQSRRVTVGKPSDVSANGSLLLKNLKFSSAGIYKAVVLNENGTFVSGWMGHLCVLAKVSKPEVKFFCDTKASVVSLTCNVAESQGLEFSWTLDGKVFTSETRQTLRMSLAHLKGENNFACSAANKVSKEKSSTVRPTCKPPTSTPPTLPCFTQKTVLAALAGGVSLILLLLIIIVVILCLCRRRYKALINLNKDQVLPLNEYEQPDSTSQDYETMSPTPDASPKPSPRAGNSAVSQFGPQTSSKPAELSTPAEVKEPSPVPKPRKKAPINWMWFDEDSIIFMCSVLCKSFADVVQQIFQEIGKKKALMAIHEHTNEQKWIQGLIMLYIK